MAKLSSPYRHFPAYGHLPEQVNTLKIVSAETIDIAWTFHVGNNGTKPKWADQYLLFSQNFGSLDKKLVEYEPSEGKVYDFFEKEFGVSSQVLMGGRNGLVPSDKVVVGQEPVAGLLETPVNYGVPKTYILKVPGPLYGTTAQGGGNQRLSDWWREQASRSARQHFNLEYGYYQLDGDGDLEAQVLPKADLPRSFQIFAGDQPTHKFYNLIKVLWEEDRNL